MEILYISNENNGNDIKYPFHLKYVWLDNGIYKFVKIF